MLKRLSCYNFTGFNCQYDFEENEKYQTDFETGHMVCKDPKNCVEGNFNLTLVDDKCEVADKDFCKNGGTCFKVLISLIV